MFKLRLQKKHVAFFAVVPLLLSTALIQVPCPVCDGTGLISNTGMGQVELLDVQSTLKNVYLVEGCFNFRVYEADVAITAQNHNPDVDAHGFVQVVLVDAVRGRVLDDQIVVVDVPALTSIESLHSIVFLTLIDDPVATIIQAAALKGEVPDEICKGTGKVSLNSYPFYKATLPRLTAIQRVEVVYQFREMTDEEWELLIGQEYSYDGWEEDWGDGPVNQH
jgi:hypothetical protein